MNLRYRFINNGCITNLVVWSMGNVEWPDTYLGPYQKSLVGVLDENREAATGGVL